MRRFTTEGVPAGKRQPLPFDVFTTEMITLPGGSRRMAAYGEFGARINLPPLEDYCGHDDGYVAGCPECESVMDEHRYREG